MALKIKLKSSESAIIGNARVTNCAGKTCLHIEGDTPVLHEKYIMPAAEANTPCKKIYLAVQLMYLTNSQANTCKTYFELVREIQNAVPSATFFFMAINDHLLNGDYHKALKEASLLIEHEKELLESIQ